jgi:putative restriction endonuclease
MYLALMEPGTYLDFPSLVPFSDHEGLTERGLLNDQGVISGRAQAAVRPISNADFNHIVTRGLAEDVPLLPRNGEGTPASILQEEQAPFLFEQERDRETALTSRLKRDTIFRRLVLRAYDERCAISGLKLINGGGRAEVQAAHIRPVEANGPDSIQNGIALSGTAHWMFDRGLISLSDDLEILISRQVNDRTSIASLINKSGRALPPLRASDRPHPHFLVWHREHCFKR